MRWLLRARLADLPDVAAQLRCDWVDEVDRLWRSPGSVGEHDSESLNRTLLECVKATGNYILVRRTDGTVAGFMSWIWADDTGVGLLRQFGGFPALVHLAIPVRPGRNAFILHTLSDGVSTYLKLARGLQSALPDDGRAVSFRRFSDQLIIRGKHHYERG